MGLGEQMATIKLTGFNASTGRNTTAGDSDVVDLDGSLTIGNSAGDAVIFNAEIDSDCVPNDDNITCVWRFDWNF